MSPAWTNSASAPSRSSDLSTPTRPGVVTGSIRPSTRPARHLQGQRDGEGRTVAWFALDGDVAAERAREVTRDREPEPGAFAMATLRVAHLHERLEQLAEVRGRDARPGVTHVDPDVVASAHRREADAAGLGELDGVGEQVRDDLRHALGVAGHRAEARREVAVQRRPFASACEASASTRRSSTSARSNGSTLNCMRPASIRDRSRISLIRSSSSRDESCTIASCRRCSSLSGPVSSPQHDVGEPDDRIERRAQLVRDGRQERRLGAVRLFGAVARDDEFLGALATVCSSRALASIDFTLHPAQFGDLGRHAADGVDLALEVPQRELDREERALAGPAGAHEISSMKSVLEPVRDDPLGRRVPWRGRRSFARHADPGAGCVHEQRAALRGRTRTPASRWRRSRSAAGCGSHPVPCGPRAPRARSRSPRPLPRACRRSPRRRSRSRRVHHERRDDPPRSSALPRPPSHGFRPRGQVVPGAGRGSSRNRLSTTVPPSRRHCPAGPWPRGSSARALTWRCARYPPSSPNAATRWTVPSGSASAIHANRKRPCSTATRVMAWYSEARSRRRAIA